MATISNHSWNHWIKTRRKSTFLSHGNLNQKGVRWTWSCQSPCFCFKFINLKALLIVLILILALIYVILIELRHFEWSKPGGISKEVEGCHKEPKKHKNRGIYSPAKISQPKELSCENGVMLQKEGPLVKPPLGTRVPFRNPKAHFAAATPPTKSPFCCEIPLFLRNGPLPTKIPTVFWTPI